MGGKFSTQMAHKPKASMIQPEASRRGSLDVGMIKTELNNKHLVIHPDTNANTAFQKLMCRLPLSTNADEMLLNADIIYLAALSDVAAQGVELDVSLDKNNMVR
jgi:hypothetical protein